MLCLSRKEDQEIFIGDDVVVSIIKLKGNTVRVGIRAPDGVRILRGELRGTVPERPTAVDRRAQADAEEAAAMARHCREAEERDQAEWQRWAESALAPA
jgi:carbon storage regulator CsrA